MSNLYELSQTVEQKEKPREVLVVRLRTYYWYNNKSLCMKKELIRLAKKTTAFDFLNEEAHNVGAEETLTRVVNLFECADGIYQVVTTNIVRDWESGYAEDWDFKLIPFKEQDNVKSL